MYNASAFFITITFLPLLYEREPCKMACGNLHNVNGDILRFSNSNKQMKTSPYNISIWAFGMGVIWVLSIIFDL